MSLDNFDLSLARSFAAKTRKLRKLEAEIDDLKSELGELDAKIQVQFTKIGASKFPAVNGMTVYLERTLWAGREDDVTTEAACAALKRAGLEDYVKEGFNTNSLSALYREWDKELEAWHEMDADTRPSDPPGPPAELIGYLTVREVFKVKAVESA